jgi:hypothetical protein
VLDDRPLRPIALSAVEKRFAARFAGAIGRFTDGERTIVLRHVSAPTRMLHPAADCYRGSGHRIESIALEQRGEASARSTWRCFIAVSDGGRARVCEQIVDADGATFTDSSAWYWAAALGQSRGPWRAVTIASAL